MWLKHEKQYLELVKTCHSIAYLVPQFEREDEEREKRMLGQREMEGDWHSKRLNR